MDLLSQYLRDFNREYLSTPEDRRRVWEEVQCFLLTVLLIIALGLALWAW